MITCVVPASQRLCSVVGVTHIMTAALSDKAQNPLKEAALTWFFAVQRWPAMCLTTSSRKTILFIEEYRKRCCAEFLLIRLIISTSTKQLYNFFATSIDLNNGVYELYLSLQKQ